MDVYVVVDEFKRKANVFRTKYEASEFLAQTLRVYKESAREPNALAFG